MAKPAISPIKKAARTANVWGWSYIVTILGAFGAGYVEPGPLRVLLLNLGILCFIIGVLELVWRHKLLKSGEARWARVLAWNQVAGTASLAWSLYLLYLVPDKVLNDYAQHSDLWTKTLPLIKKMDVTHQIDDAYILHLWHYTKIFFVYVIGLVLVLSQIWVVRHYFKMAKKIEETPAPNPALPPVLK